MARFPRPMIARTSTQSAVRLPMHVDTVFIPGVVKPVRSGLLLTRKGQGPPGQPCRCVERQRAKRRCDHCKDRTCDGLRITRRGIVKQARYHCVKRPIGIIRRLLCTSVDSQASCFSGQILHGPVLQASPYGNRLDGEEELRHNHDLLHASSVPKFLSVETALWKRRRVPQRSSPKIKIGDCFRRLRQERSIHSR
jgi:hypothetical protein